MQFGKFLIPSIAYAFLLCWFVVLSATYVKPAQGSASAGILLAGAILFLLSDMVLSMTYFSKSADYERKGMLNPESRLMIIVNHVTYYLGAIPHCAFAFVYLKNESDFRNLKSACALKRIPIF